MPTYEYACTACGHRFEAVHSMTADPLTECPECGGELRKVLHAAGIVFKGSGFYATDSRPKPSTDGASKEKGKEKPGAGGKEPQKKEPATKGPGDGGSSAADSTGSKGSDPKGSIGAKTSGGNDGRGS